MANPKHPRPSIRPWTRTATEIVARYRVFEIERHAIADGDGKPRMDVNTFRFPDWCNVVAITPNDEVVLVWQYRFGTGTMSLELPGGCVDPGEAPDAAAGRELEEEAGYVLGPGGLVHLTTYEANPAMQANLCHTYVAEGALPNATQCFDDLEELEVCLVPVADLPALLDEGVIRHGLIVAALETFLRRRERASRERA